MTEPSPDWLGKLVGEERAAGAVADSPRMTAALRRRRIDPQLVDERHLAVMVHGLELWAPTWSWRLTLAGCWCVGFEGQRLLGPGWLMDEPARRILAGDAAGRTELWIASDPIDWLTLSTHWGDADDVARGVLGIVRMPWPQVLAPRVPDGATIVVSSERLGARVLRTLGNRRVSVRLWRARV